MSKLGNKTFVSWMLLVLLVVFITFFHLDSNEVYSGDLEEYAVSESDQTRYSIYEVK